MLEVLAYFTLGALVPILAGLCAMARAERAERRRTIRRRLMEARHA